MQIIGTRGQAVPSPSYDFSGSITTGGTAQLLLPQQTQRAYLLIENISDTNMFIEVGPPTATCTISSGAVNAVSIVNAGFNYTIAPIVTFVGGGAYPGYSGVSGGLTYPNPSGFATTNVSNTNPPTLNRQAEGHCVMTGSAGNLSISSISIDDAGAGYVSAPFVMIQNDPRDILGCAVPSATSGILLLSNGGSFVMESSSCTTDAVAIFCASSSKHFTCKIML